MAEHGPFVLQGYDSFEGEYYNIWPVVDHTYDTLEEALKGAEEQWQQIQDTQPREEAGELQDGLFIISLNGIKRQYP
jgi:hypothetical protein